MYEFPEPRFKLFKSLLLVYVDSGMCAMVHLGNTVELVLSFYLSMKSLGFYHKHLICTGQVISPGPTPQIFNLCPWKTSQPSGGGEDFLRVAAELVGWEVKHKNLLNKYYAWAVKSCHYSTEFKTDQSTKRQTVCHESTNRNNVSAEHQLSSSYCSKWEAGKHSCSQYITKGSSTFSDNSWENQPSIYHRSAPRLTSAWHLQFVSNLFANDVQSPWTWLNHQRGQCSVLVEKTKIMTFILKDKQSKDKYTRNLIVSFLIHNFLIFNNEHK